MIPADQPTLTPFVVVFQDPSPQGGGQDAPPVLRRGDEAPTTDAGGEGGTQQQQQPPQGDIKDTCMESMPMLLGFVAIFYFLILRPQQKAEKKRKAMLAAVTKGERVVTNSGIHGEITALDDTTVTLKVDQDVQLTFDRAAVGRILGAGDADTGSKP